MFLCRYGHGPGAWAQLDDDRIGEAGQFGFVGATLGPLSGALLGVDLLSRRAGPEATKKNRGFCFPPPARIFATVSHLFGPRALLVVKNGLFFFGPLELLAPVFLLGCPLDRLGGKRFPKALVRKLV